MSEQQSTWESTAPWRPSHWIRDGRRLRQFADHVWRNDCAARIYSGGTLAAVMLAPLLFSPLSFVLAWWFGIGSRGDVVSTADGSSWPDLFSLLVLELERWLRNGALGGAVSPPDGSLGSSESLLYSVFVLVTCAAAYASFSLLFSQPTWDQSGHGVQKVDARLRLLRLRLRGRLLLFLLLRVRFSRLLRLLRLRSRRLHRRRTRSERYRRLDFHFRRGRQTGHKEPQVEVLHGWRWILYCGVCLMVALLTAWMLPCAMGVQLEEIRQGLPGSGVANVPHAAKATARLLVFAYAFGLSYGAWRRIDTFLKNREKDVVGRSIERDEATSHHEFVWYVVLCVLLIAVHLGVSVWVQSIAVRVVLVFPVAILVIVSLLDRRRRTRDEKLVRGHEAEFDLALRRAFRRRDILSVVAVAVLIAVPFVVLVWLVESVHAGVALALPLGILAVLSPHIRRRLTTRDKSHLWFALTLAATLVLSTALLWALASYRDGQLTPNDSGWWQWVARDDAGKAITAGEHFYPHIAPFALHSVLLMAWLPVLLCYIVKAKYGFVPHCSPWHQTLLFLRTTWTQHHASFAAAVFIGIVLPMATIVTDDPSRTFFLLFGGNYQEVMVASQTAVVIGILAVTSKFASYDDLARETLQIQIETLLQNLSRHVVLVGTNVLRDQLVLDLLSLPGASGWEARSATVDGGIRPNSEECTFVPIIADHWHGSLPNPGLSRLADMPVSSFLVLVDDDITDLLGDVTLANGLKVGYKVFRRATSPTAHGDGGDRSLRVEPADVVCVPCIVGAISDDSVQRAARMDTAETVITIDESYVVNRELMTKNRTHEPDAWGLRSRRSLPRTGRLVPAARLLVGVQSLWEQRMLDDLALITGSHLVHVPNLLAQAAGRRVMRAWWQRHGAFDRIILIALDDSYVTLLDELETTLAVSVAKADERPGLLVWKPESNIESGLCFLRSDRGGEVPSTFEATVWTTPRSVAEFVRAVVHDEPVSMPPRSPRRGDMIVLWGPFAPSASVAIGHDLVQSLHVELEKNRAVPPPALLSVGWLPNKGELIRIAYNYDEILRQVGRAAYACGWPHMVVDLGIELSRHILARLEAPDHAATNRSK